MILKFSNLLALLLSEAWLISAPDWEPGILFIGFLSSLIYQEKKDYYTHNSKNSHDIELYKKFINELPSTRGSINFIRTHDFHNSFKLLELDELRAFSRKWDNAEYEFINHDLENLRKKLLNTIINFIDVSSMNTFPEGDGWQTSIPNYLENGDIPQFRKNSIYKMNTLGKDIFNQHQELIRVGKNKLKI